MGIWLDSPLIEMLMGEGSVKREFPGKYILLKRFGIDISKEPMLVYPTLHYQNGGLEYNSRCETAIPGCSHRERFQAGFMARTGSWKSLLDVCVFGRIAGIYASEYVKEKAKDGILTLDHVRRYHKELKRQALSRTGWLRCFCPIIPIQRSASASFTTQYIGTMR